MFKNIKSVAKHSAIYSAADVLGKIVGFAVYPVYTYFISPPEWGALGLIELTSYVVGFFFTFGMIDGVIRIYYEFDTPEDREKVVSVALISTWIVSAIGLPILFLNADSISQVIFQSTDYARYFYVVFISLFFTLANEIPLTFIRIEQKSVLYSTISLVQRAIQLFFNLFFVVVLEYGIMGLLLSTLITHAVLGIYLATYTLKRIKLSFSWDVLKRLLAFGVPLIGSWLGNFILHFSDQFLLKRLMSLTAVGIYKVSYEFGFLLNMLLLAPFLRTWAPKRFEIAEEEEEAGKTFAVVFTYYCFLQFLVALGISVLIKDVIQILEKGYHSAHLYVPVLLLAYMFDAAFRFFDFAILYHKKPRYLSYLTLIAAGINVVGNLFLIPIYGAWGAAFSTVLAFFLLALATYFISQKLFYIPFEFGRIFKMFLLAFAMYLLCISIDIDNAFLSIAAKGCFACLFPFFLLPLGFYSSDEKEKVVELWHERKNWRMLLSKLTG